MNRSFTVATNSDLKENSSIKSMKLPSTTSGILTSSLSSKHHSFSDNHIDEKSMNQNLLLSTAGEITLQNKIKSHHDFNRFNAMLHLSRISHLTKIVLSVMLMVLFTSVQMIAQDIDLRLTQSIDNSQPELGAPLTFSVWLVNDGSTDASNITVESQLPLGAIGTVTTFESFGTSSYNGGTGIVNWTVPSLLANDSVKLDISSNVLARGVFFSVAEITSANETDIDSNPGNASLVEDDIATSCFSVPLFLYEGEEYTVNIPSPYNYGSTITWYKDGIPVTGATSGAVVNADSSLSISSIGNYTFSTDVNTCQATGCCAIQIIPGPYGGIGNYVWVDENKDGLQQPSESPVNGMVVELSDGNGNVLQTTTTDGIGFYEFDSLTDGSYQVKFNLTGQNEFTTQNNPANDALDSDAGLDSLSQLVTISIFDANGNTRDSSDINRFNPTIDAGIVPILEFDLALRKTLASTGPFYPGDPVTYDIVVFNQGDIDATAIKVVDYVPAGLTLSGSGWTMDGDTARYNSNLSVVSGDSTTVSITFTIDAGVTGNVRNNAEIADARDPQGDPVVDIDSTPDSDDSNDGTPSDDVIDEDGKNGGDEDDSDFAEIIVGDLAELGNYVWEDTNADGVQDLTENGVAGVIVELLDENGLTIRRDTTDASGLYLFDNLNPGDYSVRFLPSSLPSEFEFTLEGTGNDDTDDSDANENTGETVQTTLTAGESDLTWDAGIFRPASLGDYVWLDTNKDGIQDPSEEGIQGVMVVLETPSGTPLDTTYTDLNGLYLFDNLRPGDYVVSFGQPDGFTSTNPNTTGDTNDSDADPLTGESPIVSLQSGEINPTIDAGFYPDEMFDLALRKTSTQTSVIAGGQITYNITVFNQGNLDATDINVMDNVPSGLTFNDANWITSGSTVILANTIDLLAAGADTMISITFDVDPQFTGSIQNFAEITEAKGPNGEDVTDIDSTPDTNPGNDGSTVDDEIDEDGKNGGDEDDSDIATITITQRPIFDLALVKTLTTASPIYPGMMVTFDIEVINQGTVNATEVQISDYIPTGMTVADANWTQTGSIATYNNPLSVVAATTNTITISMMIAENAIAPLNNMAEITDAKGPNGEDVDDVDSNYDNDPTNEGPITDDEVNGDGKNGGDDDDSDIAEIPLSPLAALGDYVWLDSNQDGIQDPNESGIQGVAVTLESTSGSTLETTTTDINGYYSFTNLIPGSYRVRFTKPGALIATTQNASLNDAEDSDADITTGLSQVVTLTAGEFNRTIDAGYYSVACETIDSIIASNSSICVGDSSVLTATSTLGTAINWYLTPTGGTPLFTTSSGVNELVFPTTTTIYYAGLATIDPNCPADRVSLALVVNARPSNPTCGNVIEICPGETTDLDTHIINGITTPGGVFEWHTGANPSSPIVANPQTAGPGTYYLFERSGAGCYSNPTLVEVISKSCVQEIDLSLLKIADRRNVELNDIINYSITVNNAGPDAATNVVVEDILPAGLNFVSSPNFTNTGGVLSTTVASIAVNETVTLTYTVSVQSLGTIVNIAEVKAADQRDVDSTPGNSSTLNEDDDDDEIIYVTSPDEFADLSLLKLVSDNTPQSNDLVNYTIRVTNSGPNVATNVEVADLVPAGLSYQSSAGGDNITVSGNTVTATFNSINVGQTVEFTVLTIVTGTGTIINSAQVMKSDQNDPDSTPGSGVNEDDDGTAVITITDPCNPTTPLIACANPYICQGESTVINAVNCAGTIIWSNGATGNSVTVSPSISTIYTARCQVGTCLSNESNPVAVIVNQIAPPLVSTSTATVCSGEAVTLNSTGCSGTITWSTGATGSSIIVNPVASTSYTATCSIASCVSNSSNPVTVTVGGNTNPPTIAANNTQICSSESSTLTASNCAGVVTWSNGATGSSITVNPASTTSYTAICGVGSCTSPNSNSVVINVGSGQTPIISATNTNICAGSSVTLTASNCSSTLLWSTGETGTSINVSPTSTTTYTVTCGTGSCAATASQEIQVGVGSTPSITVSNTSVCQGETVSLAASNCTGTMTWSNGTSGSNIDVTPVATTTYTVTCSNGNGCNGTAQVTISVSPRPAAPVVTCGKERICAGESLTFTGHDCDGTVTWSNGVVGTSMIVNPTVTTQYSATCTVNGCESLSSIPVTITVLTETPTITASQTSVCTGESATLTAGNCSGTIEWNTGETSASITVSPTTSTTYSVNCTVEGCIGTASQTINIGGNGETPTITASSLSICQGESVVLNVTNCSQQVNWSTGDSGNSLTVNPAETTSYTATCGSASCAGSSVVTIQVGTGTPPTISASQDTFCGSGTATITVAGCSGNITWNTGDTGSSITVTPTVSTTYTATCGTGTCSSSASQIINITPAESPSITASETSICGSQSVSLSASNCSSGISWNNGETGNTITVSPTTTTTYSATCGEGTSCEGTESITISVGTPPSPVISSNGTAVCAGSQVTLTASNCSGTVIWSNGLTGNEIQVSPVAKTTYTAVCELGGTSCTSGNSNSVVIEVTSGPEAPTITCSTTRICVGESVTMTAIGCTGTVTWNNGETGESITVSPTSTTVYTATCSLGSCVSPLSAPATMNVGLPIAPVISCQNTLICAGSSTVIEAAGCTGTVIWSDGQQGAVITVSPSAVTNYSAVCDAGICQSTESNVVTVAISGQGVQAPTVTALMNTCPNTTVDLTTAVTSNTTTQGGSFVYRTGASPNSPTVNNISAIATSGMFYVFEAAGNGCFSPGSQIDVAIIACETNVDCIINPATAVAGNDTTICLSSDAFALNGNIGGAAQAATWTTSGNGSFSNATDINSSYTFSFDDVVNGSVTLTLTTNDPDNGGPCVAATSSITITINAEKVKPTISTDVSPNICIGDSITLTADQEAAGYVWSTGETTRSIIVKTPGEYTVKLVNASGCCSVSSDILPVQINSSIVAPTVNTLASNTCPATTVDLLSQVLSTPTTVNGVIEFRLGPSPISDLITNTSAVGAGDFYVFERTPTGCYSSPSQIKVAIDNCEINEGDADIAITIVGDKSDVTLGDEVVYTITVTNNGPNTATNVQIENTLPPGIKIVGATPGLIQVDDVLKTTIASLANGESITYTYTGELVKVGLVSNIAKVVGLVQTDPVASNDFSQFDVECNTCQETCIAIALKADTLQNIDGTWEITFTSVIENCGNVDLTGVEVLNDLSTMFTSPASFTLTGQPSVNTGSELVPNTGFNGVTDNKILLETSSKLVAGKTDTIQWKVTLVPNGTEGPYSTNAVAKGVGMTIFGIAQDVSDVSNDGNIIEKPSGSPTVVRLYRSPAIGLSLAISDTTKLPDGSLDVIYKAIVKNNGSLPLNGVVVEDTLANTYTSPASFFVKSQPKINNPATSLVVNPDYNGSTDNKLTLGTSNLGVGEMDTICFTVNVAPATVKEFENYAYVEGTGTLTDNSNQKVSDMSNTGYNPDIAGSDPTMLIIGDDNTSSLQNACIGTALYVADSSRKADGSYDITYHAIIRNCGNVNLKDIKLCDTLSATFTDPSVATIVGNVSLSNGSTLAIDSTFDGVTNTCLLNSVASTLPPSTVDTVRWTINLTLNSNNGPFRNNITVKGKTATDEEVMDVSNNGLDPNPEGEAPTVLNFNNLPKALIGLAKEVESVNKVEDGMYEVIFNFNVKNYGVEAFERVQVQDNLAATFGDLVVIDSTKVIETSDNLAASNMFTGKGQLIDMLIDTSSTLAVNGSGFVKLWVKVDLSQADTSTFENMALAIGYTTESSIDDQSTEGSDPDPEADGTPENNSIPTKVDFGSIQDTTQVAFTPLGIAKSVADTVSAVDGSYQVTYQVIVRNYGNSDLTDISLIDSLSNVFADSTDFSTIGDVTTSGNGTLRANTNFDGITDFELLGDSSILAVGAEDTVTFKVKVRNNSSTSQSYSNTVYGTAIDSTNTVVSDISQSGLNPDSDGDNNPGDNNEPTVLTLDSADESDTTPLAVKIPGGISPNGDGENDNWIISGIRESDNVSVKIYNRWGHLVFESDNYKVDYPGDQDGWNAASNRGIKIGNSTTVVPDGTYFYCIQSENQQLWEGKPVYDFLTIAGGEKE